MSFQWSLNFRNIVLYDFEIMLTISRPSAQVMTWQLDVEVVMADVANLN